jgi:predicted flap endonuclease-1-like 5' DNA nuclease
MKKFLRFVLLAVIVAGVVWATRDRMLPKPQSPDHHPPPFRHPPNPDAGDPTVEADTVAAPAVGTSIEPMVNNDLQRIKGIGPVYSGKLEELGITTFSALIGADSSTVAAQLDVSVESVVDWKTQATEFID